MAEQITAPLGEFKPREIEILGLIADGHSNQEIADTLFITKETVRWYMKTIYSKLGTSRRTEAVALARRFQLIGESTEETENPRRFDLPNTTGPFVGRGEEIEALKGLLGRPEVRLVTIVASGGMGKSRLSLEFGHLIRDNYKHGAAFIDLTTVQHPDDIAQAALVALGLTISGQDTPQEQLINYCREKTLLLIFDNFEELLPGAPLLGEILAAAPGVTMIATSRERLNLRAESAFFLHPIDQSGAQLFRKLAEMMHPHIGIEPDEEPAIERIVTLVGGLPLAIILAVAWLDTLPPAEIAAEIAANLDFLSAEMGDMPERQHSIHALLDPTWERLNPEEQQAFMGTAVFRGGFTRELFQQATGASVRTLQRLLHRSLVEQGRGRRYDLHPLIRQYAAEKLSAHQLVEAAKKAHLEAVAAYAAAQIGRMDQGQYLDGLRLLVMEQDNFRAALDWSLAGHEVDQGVELAETLHNFWTIRSQIQEAATYFEMALTHRPHLAHVHLRLAYAYFRLGKFESGQHHNQKATELAEKSEAFDILATSTRYSLLVGGDKRSASEAQNIAEEAMRYAQLSKDPRVIANCHIGLGMLSFDYNIPKSASLEHFQKALDFYEERGRIRGISLVIYNMALVYRFRGDTQRARALCERSLELKRQIGDRAGEARRLAALAAWDIDEEEFERASFALAEARIICEELGERRRLRYTIFQQGLLALIWGDYEKSESLLGEALALAKTLNEYEALSHAYLGLLFLLIGRMEQSETQIHQAFRTGQVAQNSSWISVIAYGKLLWAQQNTNACASVAAVLQRELSTRVKNQDAIGTKYFLEPLIYRVKQALGDDAWQQELDQATEITFERLYQDILDAVEHSA